jgi:hypothetical protein
MDKNLSTLESVIKNVKVADLQKHSSYEELYEVQSDQLALLVYSIHKNGVLSPIVITPDNKVLNGYQRVLACRELNIEEIPARVMDIPEVRQKSMMMHHNQQKIKSLWSRLNELRLLREEFEKSQGKRSDLEDKNGRYSSRKLIASAMGMSEGNIHKLEYITKHCKENLKLISNGDASINAVYKQLKAEELDRKRKATPINPPEVKQDSSSEFIEDATPNQNTEASSEAKSSADSFPSIKSAQMNEASSPSKSIQHEVEDLGGIPETMKTMCECPNCAHKFNPNLIF